MLKRIKQFYGACNAEIKPAELKIIFDNLNEAEQKLFFAMAVQDQCHAINVFKTVLKIAKEYNSVDVTLLKKTALLHDVGRKNKDLSIFDKVFSVLMFNFFPKLAGKLAKYGRGNKITNLRHALYVYLNHPQIGAILIKNLGNVKIAEIIAKHHQKINHKDSIELDILQRADNEN